MEFDFSSKRFGKFVISERLLVSDNQYHLQAIAEAIAFPIECWYREAMYPVMSVTCIVVPVENINAFYKCESKIADAIKAFAANTGWKYAVSIRPNFDTSG